MSKLRGGQDGRSLQVVLSPRFHPWEDLAEHPPFANKLTELFEREESGREPPYGPALDLGCGSAVWGIKLAERGWRVTGVDLVDKALDRGRERVQEAGVDMRLVQGDVTNFQGTDVGSGFRLILDTGTFHGLAADQRAAMGREVTPSPLTMHRSARRICASPPRSIAAGASRSDVEAAFPDWEITDVEVADTEPDPIAKLFRFDERFYRLRRKQAQARSRRAF